MQPQHLSQSGRTQKICSLPVELIRLTNSYNRIIRAPIATNSHKHQKKKKTFHIDICKNGEGEESKNNHAIF